jgi:hypothetical protein
VRSDRKIATVLKNFTWDGIIEKRIAKSIENRIQNPGSIVICMDLENGRK